MGPSTAANADSTMWFVATRMFLDSSRCQLLLLGATVTFNVGSLLYLSVCTRPDIAQALGVLTRYMSKPYVEHWQASMSVLRYLSGTRDYGITWSSELIGYADADYAGDIDTRRSTTGYVFILNGGAISWSSRLQATVAVLMSSWCNPRSSAATMERSARSVVCLLTGANTSLKSTPARCLKLLATSRAL